MHVDLCGLRVPPFDGTMLLEMPALGSVVSRRVLDS